MKSPRSLAETATAIGADAVVEQLVAGKLHAYGLDCGSGLPKPIPLEHFMIALSRLPRGTRYATTAEMNDLARRRAAADSQWDIIELPDGVVEPDYIERTKEYSQAFMLPSPLLDTWIDIASSIIYADGKPRWTDIMILSDGGVDAPRKSKAGRKPKWDWQAIERFVADRMDHHGEFSLDDPEWLGLADMEHEIQQQFPGADGAGPSHSTLQPRLTAMIERWREAKRSH
jgi:hypothetical protein